MNIGEIYRTLRKTTMKFLIWELYWTAKFITPKKLINFLKITYQDHFYRTASVDGFPLKLTVDLTANCNLHCPLCPTGQGDRSRRRGNLDFKNFQLLLDEVGDYLFEIDLFNWGEPFLNKEVFKMISYARGKRIKTRISSNLNFFPIGYEKELIRSKLHHLVVSLDGITQKTYAKYRVGGSLEKVLDGVKRINQEKRKQKSKFPFITWQYLVMSHNEHEIDEAKKLVKQWGFDRIVFQRNRGDMGEELFENDKEKIEKHGQWIPKESMETNFDLENKVRKAKPTTCNFLWNQSIVNWNGSVSPCCLYYDEKYDFGNAFKEGFSKVWNNEKYQEARKLVMERKSKDKDLICWNCIKNGFPD